MRIYILLVVLILLSCKKDLCEKKDCGNGECVDGNCVCSVGWEGVDCKMKQTSLVFVVKDSLGQLVEGANLSLYNASNMGVCVGTPTIKKTDGNGKVIYYGLTGSQYHFHCEKGLLHIHCTQLRSQLVQHQENIQEIVLLYN